MMLSFYRVPPVYADERVSIWESTWENRWSRSDELGCSVASAPLASITKEADTVPLAAHS